MPFHVIVWGYQKLEIHQFVEADHDANRRFIQTMIFNNEGYKSIVGKVRDIKSVFY